MTAQDRLIIYIAVRWEVKNRIAILGTCLALWEYVELSIQFLEMIEMFPEFILQKPNSKYIDGAWWPFSESGRRKRLAALDRAINECSKLIV